MRRDFAHLNRLTTFACGVAVVAACAGPPVPASPGPSGAHLSYPAAHGSTAADTFHGVVVPDPYRSLEDTASAQTRAWAEAQMRLTANYLALIPERDNIRERLLRVQGSPSTVLPWKRGSRYFLLRGNDLYWKGSLEDEPKVLLDHKMLSPDGSLQLGGFSFSPDGRRVAYFVSPGGADWGEVRFRDVDTGRDLPDRLQRMRALGSWTQTGKGYFYSYPSAEQDGSGRPTPNQVLYHRMGTEQTEDVLVYGRRDKPGWILDPRLSDDGRYLVVRTLHGSRTGTPLDVLDLIDPQEPKIDGVVQPLFDRLPARYGFIGNQGPVLYVWTNEGASRGRVIAVDIRTPEPERWTTVIPEAPEVLDWVKVIIVNNQLVAAYLKDAQHQLRRFALDGTPLGEIELEVPGTVGFGYLARTQEDPELFYKLTSFLHAGTIFRFDFRTGTSEVFDAPAISFDPSRYTTRQEFFTSRDGTRVPMFLTHRRDLKLDGNNPTLLYGYGGFGTPVTPFFSRSNLVWLEMGGIHAVANLRGGGEYGEEWHRAGRLENQQNTFDDFIAAAEHLIREGYTRPEKLAANGASYGGMMVQVVMNQRPDLFAAVLPERTGGDMLRRDAMLHPAEYGSLDDPQMFPIIRAYSPLQNIRPGTCYPATMMLLGEQDDRVAGGRGHANKYIAALQAAQACDRPVLLRVEPNAGHGGGGIDEETDRWAFLVKALGIKMR